MSAQQANRYDIHPAKPIPILLVEDDDIDIECVRRYFHKSHIPNPFYSGRGGAEALAMMRGEAGHEKLPQPCIVLMDINMPRMNGFQLLVEMRKSEELRQNIVFMLTTSAREEDKKRAYELNIAGYVLKENLAAFAEMLRNYFLVNEFP